MRPTDGIRGLMRRPLLRLLAINLAAGVTVAAVMVAGLLLTSPRLADLIRRDEAPLISLGLLSAGFVITFGSWAMGSAIMRLGKDR